MMVDLRPAGNSRQDALPERVMLDLITKLHEDPGLLRTRAHEIHVTNYYVHELRELVQPAFSQELPDRRDAGVVGPRPHLEGGPWRDRHRTELVDREETSSIIDLPPSVDPTRP